MSNYSSVSVCKFMAEEGFFCMIYKSETIQRSRVFLIKSGSVQIPLLAGFLLPVVLSGLFCGVYICKATVKFLINCLCIVSFLWPNFIYEVALTVRLFCFG